MFNEKPQEFHALILAAGGGSRFGGPLPKQYSPLRGRPVLRHVLEIFLSCPGLAGLHVVIDPAHADLYQESVKGLDLPRYIPGGKTRSESVYNGLKALSNLKPDDFVVIHDSARPCIGQTDILAVVGALQAGGLAVSPAVPVTDTLRRSADLLHQEPVPRENLHALQTPQGFRYETILKAHERALSEGAEHTDDTGPVIALGLPVRLIRGSKTNIKLTTQEDWAMIEKLTATEGRVHTGTGFDVHAFEHNPARPLKLCGVEIQSDLALKGHSDADAALHALTDALLGAAGAGDIGDHFPPSNPDFKNMDSAIFLEKARALVERRGGTIVNADLTLICEAPKIGPHKAAMRRRVAELLRIPEEAVNIKATTTEGLGFTGRGDGVAVQAAVSVVL